MQSDEHLVKTRQKIRYDKCRTIYDTNHRLECQKVECDIRKTQYHLLYPIVKMLER